MDEIQNPEIAALQSICDKAGGFRVVASKIGVNDQSLYQILSGVKLKSGRPKGIGPSLREKLNEHYPGWSAVHYTMQAEPPTFTLPDRKPEDAFSPLATLLAKMFDKIPEDDLLGRSQAFNAASIEIRAVLDANRPVPPGQEKTSL